ncbi:hypothetical protein CAPTEDRAFT_193699 [Capitella teleta]|uniref:Uncharacterized protein n=1 Tax=Capitella teleta TaxID=283909 RepID=R7TF88_CAPTE|nr:hypothetical protein CAPTEDRAFT_193699 [Capitella teleta]|eukprot:ELT89706.1 hypothetical protein CAPTEDRAFT_193699 [Capitella teleta]
MRKMWGVDSYQAKQAWRAYQEAKDEASAVMLNKMNQTNRKRMQDLGRGAEKKKRNMFMELKNWMAKGEAVLGVEKERFEIVDGDREITMGEVEKAWCKIKRGKAMD